MSTLARRRAHTRQLRSLLAALLCLLTFVARIAAASEAAPEGPVAPPEPEGRAVVGVDLAGGATWAYLFYVPSVTSTLSLHVGGLLAKDRPAHFDRHVSLGALVQASLLHRPTFGLDDSLTIGAVRALFVASGVAARRPKFFWQAGLGPLVYFGQSFAAAQPGVGLVMRLGYTPQPGPRRQHRLMVGVALNTDLYVSAYPIFTNSLTAFVGYAFF